MNRPIQRHLADQSQLTIAVIADSLAGQRPDGLTPQDRWPNRLANALGDRAHVLNYARGATTTDVLRRFSSIQADIAILQLGIVDCVPRVFSRVENFALARLPAGIRESIIRAVSRRRSRSVKRQYVPPERFKSNLERFLARFPGQAIIISILPATDKFLSINERAGVEIHEYRSIIESLCNRRADTLLIDYDDSDIEAITLDDGYHLNILGHEYISMKLGSLINNCALKGASHYDA